MAVKGAGEQLIKSRKRVKDHGEVFTPAWLVHDMCDLVADECLRAESRFFEPACGDGNFLVEILERKLTAARSKYKRDIGAYEAASFACVASLYGVDLLADNVTRCKERLLALWEANYPKKRSSLYLRVRQAIDAVLSRNILCGNALTLCKGDGTPLIFTEWSLEYGGGLSMREYTLDALLAVSDDEETLFHQVDKPKIATFLRSKTIPRYWELSDE